MDDITDQAVSDVGRWLHPMGVGENYCTVSEAATGDKFWETGEVSREELTRCIHSAGAVPRECALRARARQDGR